MPTARTLLDPIPTDQLRKADGGRLHLRSSTAERADIAKRLALPALKSLTVDAEVETGPGGTITVAARMHAQVVRTCVVTLEDFEESIVERFVAKLGKRGGTVGSTDLEAGPEHDGPESLGTDGWPIGELAVQHLSLLLDPYPRHPDAPPRGHADWLEGGAESALALQLTPLKGEGRRS